MSELTNKTISLFLACLIFFNPSYVVSMDNTGGNKNYNSSSLPESLYKFPEQFGTIIESYGYENKKSKKEIFVIIDAHTNLSAQYNIANILHYLSETNRLNSVYLEGASGEIDPKIFRIFSDREINSVTSQYLMENGFITGAEYFYLTEASNISLRGAENNSDYTRNLNYLKKLDEINVKPVIKSFIEHFNKLVKSMLTPAQSRVDELYTHVILEGKNLNDLVSELKECYLSEISAQKQKYVLLNKLIFISRNADNILALVTQTLSELKKSYARDKEVAGKISSLQLNLMLGSEYLEKSYDFLSLHKDKITPDRWDVINKYFECLLSIKTLSPSAFYIEIMKSYKTLTATDNGKKDLISARDILLGLYKGSQINLTPQELQYFDLNSINMEQMITLALSNKEYNDDLDIGTIVDKFTLLYELKDIIIGFYNAAEKRNDSIFTLINNDVPQNQSAGLIVGGYHRKICENFAKNGFKVSVIMPSLDFKKTFSRDLDYSDILGGKFTSMEKMIYYMWSTIVAPIISQAISNLPNKLDAERPFIARQLALMVGSIIMIQKETEEGTPKKEIMKKLNNAYANARIAHDALIRDFLKMPGSAPVPLFPRIVEYMPVANNNGFVAVFRSGDRVMAIELLKEGAKLSDDESKFLSSISGYKSENKITYKSNGYTITVADIPPSPGMLKVFSKLKSPLVIFGVLLLMGTFSPQKAFSQAGVTNPPPALAGAEFKTTKYAEVRKQLKGWIHNQGTLAGSNAQLNVSFGDLWQSYQSTDNYASKYIAGYGRVWIYDAALGVYSALADKDYVRAKKAVGNFMNIIRAEKKKGYRGLFHFSYNTSGDDFIDPREPLGATLWAMKAMYAYMLETGDMTYFNELTTIVRQSVLPLQNTDKSKKNYGFIGAGYAHPEGLRQGGYNIHGDLNALNRINEDVIMEHNADYIDVLRLMALVIDKHHPAIDGKFRNELASRHSLVMQASFKARSAKHWPTAFDKQGKPNWSKAVDHYTWLATTFMDYNEDIVWESIQILFNEFTTTTSSFEILVDKTPKRMKLPKSVKGLIFFDKDFVDPYVSLSFDERTKLTKLIQPEATAGAIVVLRNFADKTKDPGRKMFALKFADELADGLAVLHKEYAKVYPGGGLPYATENISDYFNSTPSMAATATYHISLTPDYRYFLGVPIPKGFENALTSTDTAVSAPPQTSKEKPPEPQLNTARTSVKPSPLPVSDSMTKDVTFKIAQVERGHVKLKLNIPADKMYKYKIVVLKKTDAYYVQPTSGFERDFAIRQGEFVINTFRPDLESGKTVILIVDPAKLKWRHDEVVSDSKLKSAKEQGAVIESIVAEARLSTNEISQYKQELIDAGILPEDLKTLMELTDRERIVGDFTKLRLYASATGEIFQEILLRAYAREIGHQVVRKNNLQEITGRFIDRVSREKFDRMKKEVSEFWNIQFRDDFHFMDELVDFYMDSRFSGKNEGFFMDDLYKDLWVDLKFALGDDLFDKLFFKPSTGLVGSPQYLMDQVEHVNTLVDTAKQLGLDIKIFDRTSDEVLDYNPVLTFKQYLNAIRISEFIETSL